MARRRGIQQLSEDVTRQLKGRDTTSLPKRIIADIAKLEKALGLKVGQFLKYAPRTRSRYLAGGRRGQTAEDVRRVDRERRQAKTKTPASISPTKWRTITKLRDELRTEGIDVVYRPDNKFQRPVVMDSLGYHDLYSDESLRAHISVYGEDYVVTRMRKQLKAVREYNASGGVRRNVGRDNMDEYNDMTRRDFAASPAVNTEFDDERWFWYHSNTFQFMPGVAA